MILLRGDFVQFIYYKLVLRKIIENLKCDNFFNYFSSQRTGETRKPMFDTHLDYNFPLTAKNQMQRIYSTSPRAIKFIQILIKMIAYNMHVESRTHL